MGSNSKKTLPISDEKNLSKISAYLNNFKCNINPSDQDDLVKKPGVQKMLKKMANAIAKEDKYDDCRKFLPVKLLEELVPGFDLEEYLDEIHQMRSKPEYIKGTEDFIKRFQDPPMSVCSTPVDVNNPAGP